MDEYDVIKEYKYICIMFVCHRLSLLNSCELMYVCQALEYVERSDPLLFHISFSYTNLFSFQNFAEKIDGINIYIICIFSIIFEF